MSRIAASALETALNGEQPRTRRLSGVKAVATGAVLATAARMVASKAPALPRMPDFSELGENVKDRLAEHGWIEREDFVEDEELDEEPEEEEGPEDEDDGQDDEDQDDGGPYAEGAAEWDEEDEDEGEEEAEEEPREEADEGEAEGEGQDAEASEEGGNPGIELGANGGSGDRRRARTPDLMQLLNEHGSSPPVRRRSGRQGRELDPASRPPEPPREQRGSRAKNSNPKKAKAGKG